MPFYDYQCKKCNRIQEERHGMNDAPKVKCAKCRRVMERVIGAAPIAFKCGGFYETDYKKKT